MHVEIKDGVVVKVTDADGNPVEFTVTQVSDDHSAQAAKDAAIAVADAAVAKAKEYADAVPTE